MRNPLIAASCLFLAGCGGGAEQAANSVAAANVTHVPTDEIATADIAETLPSPEPSYNTVEPIAPGQPGGLPDDRAPISEAPFTADSAQGAASVVQTYYALIGEKKYADAYKLWEPEAVGMTQSVFVAGFDRYTQYNAQIGAPGEVDAGAGQRHVEVPVQLYGRFTTGKPFHMLGSVTLHRTGDVDGATAEQKRWRIKSTDIK